MTDVINELIKCGQQDDPTQSTSSEPGASISPTGEQASEPTGSRLAESEDIPRARAPRAPRRGSQSHTQGDDRFQQALHALYAQFQTLQDQIRQQQSYQTGNLRNLAQQIQDVQDALRQLLSSPPQQQPEQKAQPPQQQLNQTLLSAQTRQPDAQQPETTTSQQIQELANLFSNVLAPGKEYHATTKETIKKQLREALEETQIKDILEIIDAQAFVTKLIATDDNLAAYDPEDVFEAYVFLYSLAPQALKNEIVASTFIQKYLAQGKTIDPYDVRQLAAIEQGLRGKSPMVV